MTMLKFPEARTRVWPPGPTGLLLRIRDLIETERREDDRVEQCARRQVPHAQVNVIEHELRLGADDA